MAIERGDILIMSQNGIDQVVVAQTGVVDGMVQIKNKGTHSPCPAHHLYEVVVLTDPTDNGLDGKPIYIKPDGQATSDPEEAKLFKSPEEAEEFRKSKSGIPYFVPKKLKDCLGN